MNHDLADKNFAVSNDGGESAYSVDYAQLAVLMDIREQLKIVSRKLSALECPRFTAIPRTLTEIRRNTAKPRKRKATRR